MGSPFSSFKVGSGQKQQQIQKFSKKFSAIFIEIINLAKSGSFNITT